MRGSLLYVKSLLNKVILRTKFHNAYYDIPENLCFTPREWYLPLAARENYLGVSCNIVRKTISITASYVSLPSLYQAYRTLLCISCVKFYIVIKSFARYIIFVILSRSQNCSRKCKMNCRRDQYTICARKERVCWKLSKGLALRFSWI